MKKIIILIFLLVLTGCRENGTITKVSCDESKRLIEEEKAVLVDVRSKDEYNESHLEGAINKSVYLIEDIDVDKDLPIIVYCKSGARSNKAALELLKLGYKKIYNLGPMSKCS